MEKMISIGIKKPLKANRQMLIYTMYVILSRLAIFILQIAYNFVLEVCYT